MDLIVGCRSRSRTPLSICKDRRRLSLHSDQFCEIFPQLLSCFFSHWHFRSCPPFQIGFSVALHTQILPRQQISCKWTSRRPFLSCISSEIAWKKLKHTKILLNFHLSLTMGPLFCSVLLMFTSIRNMVTNRAMRPGTISTGMRKPMKEAIVKRKVGR